MSAEPITDELIHAYVRMGVPLPERHPLTGETFVACTVSIKHHPQRIEMLPPPRPPQEWLEHASGCCSWDPPDACWCDTKTVRLSDKEHAERIAAWKKATANFQSIHYVRGETTISGRFHTVTQATALGETAIGASRWLWRQVDNPSSTPPGIGCRDGWMGDPECEATGPA